jgi:hypothetical protein
VQGRLLWVAGDRGPEVPRSSVTPLVPAGVRRAEERSVRMVGRKGFDGSTAIVQL